MVERAKRIGGGFKTVYDSVLRRLFWMKAIVLRLVRKFREIASNPSKVYALRVLSIILSFAMLLTILGIQYSKYGTERYLGWDTVHYVYLANLVNQFGPTSMIQVWGYPHLYVLALWALGNALGSFDLAERLFPLVWALALLIAYERISWQIHPRLAFSSLTTGLAALSMNTLRVFSDLNRTLMAFALSLLILSMWSLQEDRLKTRSIAFIATMLLAVAATVLEIYFLLFLAMFFVAAVRRNLRFLTVTVLLLFIPLLLLSPLIFDFLLDYRAVSLVIPSFSIALSLEETFTFLGGSAYALPVVALGCYALVRRAWRGSRSAQVILGWLFASGVALILLLSGVVNLPPVRVLYLVPVPLLLSSSILVLNRQVEESSAHEPTD